MMEKIAMWGGIAGIVIAIFAIIILYLTRSNIIDLLDRDVVMYDKNYEAKKEALEQGFNCLDLVALNGLDIKNNSQYIQRAKEAYNALLCTLNSAKLYQEFYRMAIDTNVTDYTIEDIEKFKIACRAELITKRKNKNEGFSGSTNGALNAVSTPMPNMPRPQAPAQQRPMPAQPPRPQARPQGQVPPRNNG